MKIFTVLLFLIPVVSFAGSNDSVIVGKSGTGRTHFTMRIQDMSGPLLYLKFTIDGESYEIEDPHLGGNRFESVINDSRNGVYAITCKSDGKEIQFWMIPSSLERTVEKPGEKEWKFRARIIASDPRKKKKGLLAPEIELNCKLSYSI